MDWQETERRGWQSSLNIPGRRVAQQLSGRGKSSKTKNIKQDPWLLEETKKKKKNPQTKKVSPRVKLRTILDISNDKRGEEIHGCERKEKVKNGGRLS